MAISFSSPAPASSLFLPIICRFQLLFGPLILQSLFALGIGGRIRDNLEKRIHPGLWFSIGRVCLFEFLDLDLDAFGIETGFLDQEFGELFCIWFLPLEFDVGVDLVVVKEVSGQHIGRGGGRFFFFCFVVVVSLLVCCLVFVFLVRDPTFGNRVFRHIFDNWQDFFDASVFANKLESRLGPNSLDSVAVVTSQKDAQIHKLVVGQSQTLDGLFVVHGLDLCPLRGLVGKGQFSDQYGGRKRQGIHILRTGCIDLSSLAESRRLGLCLHGCQNDRDTHEPQQPFAVFVFLASGSRQPL
mmetsp:Transcript_22273/g.62052  ORF Transcript_22273/g.62052 Transcript_22273/m.62052 type:complete len:298 (-) Transcript_22273:718-1611(-)